MKVRINLLEIRYPKMQILIVLIVSNPSFIGLKDQQLRDLAKTQEVDAGHFTGIDPNKKVEDPIDKIKKEGTPLSHYEKVKKFLEDLKHVKGIGDPDYQKLCELCELIEPLKAMCEQCERLFTNTLEERARVNVG